MVLANSEFKIDRPRPGLPQSRSPSLRSSGLPRLSPRPHTEALGTRLKNSNTTVFLYRSVAKLSERAGVLGEDAGNVAPHRVLPKLPRSS
jgi:hypothetical protein